MFKWSRLELSFFARRVTFSIDTSGDWTVVSMIVSSSSGTSDRTTPNRTYASSRMPLRKHGCCTLPAVDITRSPGWMGIEQTRIGVMGGVFGVFGLIYIGLIEEVGVFGLVAVRAFLFFLSGDATTDATTVVVDSWDRSWVGGDLLRWTKSSSSSVSLL